MQGSWPVALAVSALGASACVCALVLIALSRRDKAAKAAARAALGGGETVSASGMRLDVTHAQHIGHRSQQQDAYGVSPADGRVIAVVCDGMGGMKMGGEAARAAVGVIMPVFDDKKAHISEAILTALNRANEIVYAMCQGGGGATAVIACVDSSGLSYASAGDSRIYVLRDGYLRQLGQDHIFYYDLLKHVRAGSITLEEANAHPEREHLTSFLGKEMLDRVNASDRPFEIKAGDAILLCTDGVYRTLSDQEIAATLDCGGAGDIIRAVTARNDPRQDNLTAIVIKAREN